MEHRRGVASDASARPGEAVRVLVCGGRDYADHERAFAVLDDLHARRPIAIVIHGGARGADALADAWAMERGAISQAYPADWATHGKGAGPIRNAIMIAEGKPDLVVAFVGGKGTADMVAKAKRAGVQVVMVER